MSYGLYLFCLTPQNALLKIGGSGIDPAQPLFTESVAGVTAILSTVALEDFCGTESREKLSDLAWVAPRALRHEEAIMTIMRQAPVLPVRFGCVFSSLDAMALSLERHREALSRFFIDTGGQKEWTLKAFVDRAQAKSRLMAARLAEEQAQLAGLAPGKRYLLEQKIKGAVDRELAAWLKGIADDIFASFRDEFSTSSEGRLLSQELTGRDDEMFIHTALLVPECSVESLQRLTSEWNVRHEPLGVQLEASGPWPPYHFTPVLEMDKK